MQSNSLNQIINSVIKTKSINCELSFLDSEYNRIKSLNSNTELIQEIEDLQSIVNQYDIICAFISGCSDKKNNRNNVLLVMQGGIEEVINTSLNYEIPQYKTAKRLLGFITQNNEGNLIDELLECMSYINYEYIKIAYIFGFKTICSSCKVENVSSHYNLLQLGEKIKYCRKRARLTQEKVGNIIGVNRTLLSKYENSVCMPKITFIKQYSKLFHISYIDMVNENISLENFKEKYPLSQFN